MFRLGRTPSAPGVGPSFMKALMNQGPTFFDHWEGEPPGEPLLLSRRF